MNYLSKGVKLNNLPEILQKLILLEEIKNLKRLRFADRPIVVHRKIET